MPSRAGGSRRRPTRPTRLQTNIMLQQVTAEQVKVQQVEKEGQIKVQEAEIVRHEKELIATVLKGAEIEAPRIENLAAAEKARLTTEAEGRAPRFVRKVKRKPASSSRRARLKRRR